MTPADPAPTVFPPPAGVEAVPRAAAGTGAELLARFPPRRACLSWPGTRAGRPRFSPGCWRPRSPWTTRFPSSSGGWA